MYTNLKLILKEVLNFNPSKRISLKELKEYINTLKNQNKNKNTSKNIRRNDINNNYTLKNKIK